MVLVYKYHYLIKRSVRRTMMSKSMLSLSLEPSTVTSNWFHLTEESWFKDTHMDIDTTKQTNEENKDWLLVIIFWKIMRCVKALRKRNEARPAHSHLLTKPWNRFSYILKETYPNNWFAKISQMNNTHTKKNTLRNNKGARVCFMAP